MGQNGFGLGWWTPGRSASDDESSSPQKEKRADHAGGGDGIPLQSEQAKAVDYDAANKETGDHHSDQRRRAQAGDKDRLGRYEGGANKAPRRTSTMGHRSYRGITAHERPGQQHRPRRAARKSQPRTISRWPEPTRFCARETH